MRRVRELWLVDVPALGFAVATALGALAGLIGIAAGVSTFALAIVAVAFAVAALLFAKSRRLAMAILFSGFALLVLHRADDAVGRETRQRIARAIPESQAVHEVGEIVWKERSRDDRSGYLWLANATLITDSDTVSSGELLIRLHAPIAEWETAQIGDYVAGRVHYTPAHLMHASRSGVLFWSLSKEHCGDSRLAEGEEFAVVGGEGGIRQTLYVLRESLLDVLEAKLSPDARAMCGALLLGERVSFSPEFQSDLYLTGLTHLFALSGLNTGLIAALIWFVLSLMRVHLAARVMIVLTALAIYAALGIGAPSLVRSSLMAAMIVGTRLLHRKGNAVNYILAAFTIELLIWPLHMLDPGFILSYLAIGGLTAGYVILAGPFARLFGDKRGTILRRTAQLVGSAISAQISTSPMSAMMFGRVPGLAVFANVIAVPGFSLLLVMTILLIALSFVSDLFAGWVANSVELLSFGLTRVVTWSAAIPGAGLTVSVPAAVSIVWLALSIGALISFLRLRARIGSALLLIGLNLIAWSNVYRDDSQAEVRLLGERCALISSGHSAALVGCGHAWESERIGGLIAAELAGRTASGIDLVFLPIRSAASIGSLPGVLGAVDVRKVLWQPPSRATWTAAMCDAALDDCHAEAVSVCAGLKMEFDDSLSVVAVWPPEGTSCECARALIGLGGGASVYVTSEEEFDDPLKENLAKAHGLVMVVSRDGGIRVCMSSERLGGKSPRGTGGKWVFEKDEWVHHESTAVKLSRWLNLPHV